MRNLIQLALIVLVVNSNILAQPSQNDYSVSWSQTYNSKEESNRIFDVEPIGYINNNSYSFSPKSYNPLSGHIYLGARSGRINMINDELNTIKSKMISVQNNGEEGDFEFVLKLGNRLVAFSSFKDVQSKTNSLYFQDIDINTLNSKGEAQKVVEIDFSQYSRFKKSIYSYSYSEDSSKVAISHNLVDNEGKILNFGIAVLSSECDLIFKTEEINLLEKGFLEINNFAISNKGEIVIVGKHFSTDKDRKKSIEFKSPFINPYTNKVEMRANYNYKVVVYSSSGKQSQPIDLSNANKHLIQLRPAFMKNGNLFVQGLYGQPESMAVVGSCSFIINLNQNKLVKSNFEPYSDELLSMGLSSSKGQQAINGAKKGKDYEKGYYSLNKLVPDNNGGFWSLAENFNIIQKTSDMMSWVEYTFKHIYISKYDQDGTLVNTSKIVKKQVFLFDSRYASYFPFESYNYQTKNDELFIIYPEVNNSKMKYKLRQVLVDKLDSHGETNQSIITVDSDSNFNYPNLGGRFSANSLFFYGYKNRDISYLKIDFD